MILVVGATGQLGSAVVRRLQASGAPVRALVRPGAPRDALGLPGVEFAPGDLRDPASLARACRDVTAIVATATVVFPRGRTSFEEVEGEGYTNLIAAAERAGAEHLLYCSIVRFPDRLTARVPTLRWKADVERRLAASTVPATVFRAGPFMDDYFALMGSTLPLRGEAAATLRRPFWLSRAYLGLCGALIDHHGLALVPGDPDARHSFVALEDVAAFLVNAIGHPAARGASFDLGGPERLSWRAVAEIYARVLERPVRPLRCAPSWLLRGAATMLEAVSPAAANQLAILWALSMHEIDVDCRKAAELFGVRLTRAEEYLLAKARLRS